MRAVSVHGGSPTLPSGEPPAGFSRSNRANTTRTPEDPGAMSGAFRWLVNRSHRHTLVNGQWRPLGPIATIGKGRAFGLIAHALACLFVRVRQ